MVRNYKRTTEKKGWSPEQFANAVKAIQLGSEIRAAAKKFNIPESTIRGRLKKLNSFGPEKRNIENLGRNPIFTIEQEQMIANHVVEMGNLFYGVTPRLLRRMAFDFAEANRLPNKFNRELKLAGIDWLGAFLKRNPEISLRQPEGTSINCTASFNDEAVRTFYNNLDTVVQKYGFAPDKMFNVDEFGITTSISTTTTSAERGKIVTILCSVNATGSYIPPMIIFPTKQISLQLEKEGPTGYLYACSNNGWSNDALFLKWLNHFQAHVKSNELDPVLLILDNHCSHISLDIYNFCREHNIVLLSIPPHISNHLHPLDLTFFGPLKQELYSVYNSHIISTTHKKITIYDIARLFNKAYLKVTTMDKGILGFETAGIYPFNPENFTGDNSAPAQDFCKIVLDVEALDYHFEEKNIAVSSPSTCTSIVSSDYQHNCSSTQVDKILEIPPVPQRFNKTGRKGEASKEESEILTASPQREKHDIKRKQISSVNMNLDMDIIQSVEIKEEINVKSKKRRIKIEVSDEDSEEMVEDLCQDSDSSTDFVNTYCEPESADVCMICNEFRRSNELWYRCTSCGLGAHSECRS